jgi:hypothetical protein
MGRLVSPFRPPFVAQVVRVILDRSTAAIVLGVFIVFVVIRGCPQAFVGDSKTNGRYGALARVRSKGDRRRWTIARRDCLE